MPDENSKPDQKIQGGTASEIFEAMVNAPGPIDDIMAEAAREIVNGGNFDEIKLRTLERIRGIIESGEW